jgi:hypothetical protein
MQQMMEQRRAYLMLWNENADASGAAANNHDRRSFKGVD